MESVTAIVETSDLFIKILFILEDYSGVTEYSALVFWVSNAHVIVKMSNHFLLIDVVLFIEFGALFL